MYKVPPVATNRKTKIERVGICVRTAMNSFDVLEYVLRSTSALNQIQRLLPDKTKLSIKGKSSLRSSKCLKGILKIQGIRNRVDWLSDNGIKVLGAHHVYPDVNRPVKLQLRMCC